MSESDLRKQKGVKIINDVSEPVPITGSISVSGNFGDTAGYANLTPDGLDQLVLAADTDFKEVILYHENATNGWIKFGGSAAVVGEGFPIRPFQYVILDRCRDEIRIIFEAGYDSAKLQINTVEV